MKSAAALTIALALTSIPASVAASDITYLDCAVNGLPWKVSLDESAGKISYEHSKGVVTEDAVFTADKVVWETMLGTFAISRVDLTFTQTLDGHVFRHTCKLSAPRKRLF